MNYRGYARPKCLCIQFFGTSPKCQISFYPQEIWEYEIGLIHDVKLSNKKKHLCIRADLDWFLTNWVEKSVSKGAPIDVEREMV